MWVSWLRLLASWNSGCVAESLDGALVAGYTYRAWIAKKMGAGMTRAAFGAVSAVPLEKLLLDTKNPRIRAGHDQSDCIERLLRKSKQMLALAKDIATNGLSTAPILVEPLVGKKYIVWDGNRRITALKLLNEPSLCGSKALAAQFAATAAKAAISIPSTIDVLASSDRQALLKEVLARHAGALDGAGQLTWDALLRTMFLLGHKKAPSDYRLAGLLLMWAEENDVEVDDAFPITTIHRFLNKKSLGRLGFRDVGEAVEPVIEVDAAIRVVERIVQDFAPSGGISVNEVYDQTQQDAYIESIRVDLGLASPQDKPKGGQSGSWGKPSNDHDNPPFNEVPVQPVDRDDGDDEEKSQPKRSRGVGYRTTHKPEWDRKSIVRPRFRPEIPDEMWKAGEVLRELRRTKTEDALIATAALFRIFVELSTKVYFKRHQNDLGEPRQGEMHKSALDAAAHMRRHGRLDQGELDATIRRFKERSQSPTPLQYATLNDYMHSFRHMPDRQSLHILWGEIDAYLEACWDDARRSQ